MRARHATPLAAAVAAVVLLLSSCADDGPTAAPPTTTLDPTTTVDPTTPTTPPPSTAPPSTAPPTTPPPSTAPPDPSEEIVETIDDLESSRWWEWAGGIVGVPLTDDTTRRLIAADVVETCAYLTVVPESFSAYLAELDAIAARRPAVADQPLESASYAVTLDAAIHAACPDAALIADSLRPDRSSVDLDDFVRDFPLVVPDPRPGDLRSDPESDTLPLDYERPTADRIMLDLVYGDGARQKLDLYLPALPAPPNRLDAPGAPVIVFLHSGGWVGGDKQFVPDMVMRFVERGYAVAAVGYRLAPAHPFPEPVQDVKRAIRWLKAFGDREGLIDGNRFVVYGTSAGGHLASFVGATPGRFEPGDLTPDEAAQDSSVAGVVSVAGPTDLVTMYATPHPWAAAMTGAFAGCAPCGETELSVASATSHLHADLPPAYWAYGEDDTLVEVVSQGAATATAWGEFGGVYSSWLDLVEGRGHNMDATTLNQRWLETFVDFATGSG